MAYPQQAQLKGLCDGYDNVSSQFFGCDGEQGLAQNHVPDPLFPVSASQEVSNLQPPLMADPQSEPMMLWDDQESWTQFLCNGHDNELNQILSQSHVQEPLVPIAASEGASNPQSLKQGKRKKEKTPVQVFRTRSETTHLDDGFRWRKYGRKTLKCSIHPRDYYKCWEDSCSMKKKVEKDPKDEGVVITIYEGSHNHESLSPAVYCITEPLAVATPGSKPAILIVNTGIRL